MNQILRGATSPIIHPRQTFYEGLARGAGGGGGKGGKSGGGGGFTEAANTNRSRAIVRLIDLLSEGPILGLEDGGKSIFLNNTPLISPDGKENFKGVTWEMRIGSVDQDPIQGFPIAENTIAVETEVRNGVGPVTRTVSSDSATMARVVLRFPALFHQKTQQNKLDQTNLAYTIEVRAEGGTYAVAHNVSLRNRKWMAPYEKEHMVVLPESPTSTWDIRVTKITADPDAQQNSPNRPDNSSFLQNSVIFASIGMVTERKLIYPDSALIAISFDASTFGSSLPERWYKLKGRLLKVPANYDPVTRTYATTGEGTSGGMWDGVTFKTAWTNNPAWCCYDVLINQRYACGLDESFLTITRFELYMIGQYCDERVPDGYGGFEPRYSMNAWINTADDAYRFMQRMVQVFRGMTFWAAGQVSFTADMPDDPVNVISNTDVVDGEFVYEGASLKTMHTMARVSWLNPDLRYERDVEMVDDAERLELFGERILDLEAFGCTSRGEAHRMGKWALDTERYSTEIVSFTVPLELLDLRPGQIFGIADQWRDGVRSGGRLRDVGSDWVLLDSKFAQTSSGYTITTVRPDGDLQRDLSITSFDDTDPDYTKVSLSSPFPVQPQRGSAWSISTDDLSARQFRVLAIQEQSKVNAKVTALYHDPTKFDRIEYGISLESAPYQLQTPLTDPIPDPTEVAAIATVFGDGVTTISRVTVSASPPRDARAARYQFRAVMVESTDDSALNDTVVTVESDEPTADFDHLPPGEYMFASRSVGPDGRTSEWVDTSESTLVTGVRTPLPQITGVLAEGSIRRVLVKWSAPTDRNDIRHYEVWRSSTLVANPEDDGATLFDRTDALQTVDSAAGLLVPGSTWHYWVRAVGLQGNKGPFSEPDQATVDTVQAVDVGSHVITHNHITYTAVTRIAHDELVVPFAAEFSDDEPILSITVDVDHGGKVAIIGRVYTPPVGLAQGDEPFGGGGGTEIPDTALADPYTDEPLDPDPPDGLSVSVTWVTGGGARDAISFTNTTGLGGSVWLTQLRDNTSSVRGFAEELDILDAGAGLQQCEVSAPVFSTEFLDTIAWHEDMVFNFAAKIEAPAGYEISLDGSTGWGATIYKTYTQDFGADYWWTDAAPSIEADAFDVYYRPIGEVSSAGTIAVDALPATSITVSNKEWERKVSILTGTDAAAAGLTIWPSDKLILGAAQYDPGTDATYMNVTYSDSGVAADVTFECVTDFSDADGTDPITAGADGSGSSWDDALADAWSGVNLFSGPVLQADFDGTGNVTLNVDPFTSTDYAINGTSQMVMAKGATAGSFLSAMTSDRSELDQFDAADFYAIEGYLGEGIEFTTSQTGSIDDGGTTSDIATDYPAQTTNGAPETLVFVGHGTIGYSDPSIPSAYGPTPFFNQAYPSFPSLPSSNDIAMTAVRVPYIYLIKQRDLDA